MMIKVSVPNRFQLKIRFQVQDRSHAGDRERCII